MIVKIMDTVSVGQQLRNCMRPPVHLRRRRPRKREHTIASKLHRNAKPLFHEQQKTLSRMTML